MSGRISKSLRNARYGIASQILYLILAFVLRIAITKNLGIVALSLNGLFSEVLTRTACTSRWRRGTRSAWRRS